jgi:hypothetical protein
MDAPSRSGTMLGPSSLGPLSVALPATFSHCLCPLTTIADAMESGVVEIPLVHRVSAASSGEMEFVRAFLSRISLTTSPDVRTVAVGPSTNFATGYVYRALHSSDCIVPGQDADGVCSSYANTLLGNPKRKV